ncbi:MAG: tetratricopeptide repeat protein [Anaerolineales bacterium]|nr:tetratricopeptide repeat protein [Anaerolineales bacterium]
MGRPEEAEAVFGAALAADPQYAKAHSNLGLLLKELGRPEEAEAACRAAWSRVTRDNLSLHDLPCSPLNPNVPTDSPLTLLPSGDGLLDSLIPDASLLLEAQIVGHSSTSIASQYDRTWQDKVKEAVQMRALPFKQDRR